PSKDSERHSSCANSFPAKFARARPVSRGAAYHLPLLLGDSAHSHHREHSQDSPICMRVCRWKKLLAGLNGPEIHLSPHHRAWRFYPLARCGKTLILGGAALQRCLKWLVFMAALAD